jgi:lipopolysaccharide export system permease protein
MVMLVLLALYFFTTLMSEMGMVGKGNYRTINAVIYSVMLLPRQAYELFPLVALVGSILGIGALASSNELTVLRAAGVSINRLTLIVMKTGLLIILLMIVMGETLAPYLEKQAQQQRLSQLALSVSLNSSAGLWARDGNDFININSLVPGGHARNIKRYRFDGIELVGVDSARSGYYENNVWVVGPVVKTQFYKNRVTTQRVKEERWTSTLTPDIVGVAAVIPENLALWELFDFIDYMQENSLASERYETAMWMRLFSPLATGGMILLAMPFVFGPLRTVTIGQRVMVGSLVGILFYLMTGVFSRLGVLFDIEPVISAGAPILLVYSLWLYLMRRVN